VIAAFVIGLFIAVIELPCTGQVYLPTIAFMVHNADMRGQALMQLLLYNLFFVAPLIIIFIFASFGLPHERLILLLRKHAALVKFSTAGLLLALFAFFVISFMP
jgi:cytochrome c biogenesis protein CcdA